MGQDKALLPFRGGVLAQAIAKEVKAAAGHAAFVGIPCTAPPAGFSTVLDMYPGEGPLGGILTALQNTSSYWNLVVACDLPNVSAPFLRELLDAAECWDVDALLPAGPSHRLEPLCAVYHRRTRQALHAAFSSGQRKITAALEGLRVAVLLVPETAPLQNVNTPADWAAYARG
jgi:molybdopterin-guanine dinucleotide biosynthesis protein A